MARGGGSVVVLLRRGKGRSGRVGGGVWVAKGAGVGGRVWGMGGRVRGGAWVGRVVVGVGVGGRRGGVGLGVDWGLMVDGWDGVVLGVEDGGLWFARVTVDWTGTGLIN